LTIAANYSGRWDLANAMHNLALEVEAKRLKAEDITEALISQYLCLADLPEPDLFIRTSGEQRISNFLLWQLAYTELYFIDIFWPDFNVQTLEEALAFFVSRRRRYGLLDEQLLEPGSANETIEDLVREAIAGQMNA
jgi:undecaprenyl diphosphate synthase